MKTAQYMAIILTVAFGVLPATKALAANPSGLISEKAMSEIIQGSSRMDELYAEAKETCDAQGSISPQKVRKQINEIEGNMKAASILIGGAIRRAGLQHSTGPVTCTPALQAHTFAYALGIGNPFFILKSLLPTRDRIGFVRGYPACQLMSVLDQAQRYSVYILDKANDDRSGDLRPNCNLDSYMNAN